VERETSASHGLRALALPLVFLLPQVWAVEHTTTAWFDSTKRRPGRRMWMRLFKAGRIIWSRSLVLKKREKSILPLWNITWFRSLNFKSHAITYILLRLESGFQCKFILPQ
jgi:hypothetical protein